jgi:hypothetical protein
VAGFTVEPGVGAVAAGLLGLGLLDPGDGAAAAVAARAGAAEGRGASVLQPAVIDNPAQNAAAVTRRNTSQVIGKP